jgi:hypothetical protein
MPEFSRKGYGELLSGLRDAGYSFCGYEEIEGCLREKQSFVVLRHDIDLSLRSALEIARIEYEQGARATYFVLFRSPFYNILSRSNMQIMQEIHHYGHQIATHLDLTAYDNDLRKALVEVEVLYTFYPYINKEIASLHSSYDLDQMPVTSSYQLNNVYGPCIRKDVAYISDSTGRWRYGHPFASEAFENRKPIQLLTHPVWWVQEGETEIQKLECQLHSDYQHGLTELKRFMPKLFRYQMV